VTVYNLSVDDDATFFVGTMDALVHDNSRPEPGEPRFDAIEPESSGHPVTARVAARP
jgi:hypothetical protein